MYLTQHLTSNYYWLCSKVFASNSSKKSIEACFNTLRRTNTYKNNFYIKNNLLISKKTNEPIDKIICEFPDNWTYNDFKENYPELLI